jgi:hypothetical protein
VAGAQFVAELPTVAQQKSSPLTIATKQEESEVYSVPDATVFWRISEIMKRE